MKRITLAIIATLGICTGVRSQVTHNESLTLEADNLTGWVASRVYLKSHNNYRGAGIFTLGQTNNWFFGNPYTDQAGSFMIGVGDKSIGSDQIAQLQHSKFYLNSSGNVGIGTNGPSFGDISYGNPTPTLHVRRIGSSGAFKPIARFQSGPDSNNSGAAIVINHVNDRGLILEAGRGINDQAVAYFGLVNSGGTVSRFMSAVQGGHLGIGTDNPDPSHKLSVNGSIRAKEVVVDTGWSDFVFDDDYNLRTLREVEAHIEEHGHLPEVPSAEEVESEGLSVGEAQKIMMQKIEELTLYMIDLKKENEALKERVQELETN